MKQQLFSFFCAEKANNLSEIIIVINDSFQDMQEIYDYIGKCIYGDFPEKNPIYSNSYYFGSNPSTFSDCLSSFFYYIDDKTLRFEIKNFNNKINKKEIYIFLQSFLWINVYFDYEKRLQVLISKDIMKIYLEEADRLSWLDVNAEDVFDEDYINPED